MHLPDKGLGDKVKGKIKETYGNITGDDKVKVEGLVDQAVGKTKEVATDVKEKAEEVFEGLKDKTDDIIGDIKEKFNK